MIPDWAQPKTVADKVYGSNIGVDKGGAIVVLKIDLGGHRHAFHMSDETTKFLLANMPTLTVMEVAATPEDERNFRMEGGR